MKHTLPILILGGLAGACWWLSEQPGRETASIAAPEFRQPETRTQPVSATELRNPRRAPAPAAARRDLPGQITLALRSGTALGREHAFNQLLPRLIAEDPAEAGHLALAWEEGPLREEFLAQVVRHWTEHDVGGALTWLTSLLNPSDRRLASLSMITAVAQSDQAGALDLSHLLRVGLDDGSAERMAQIWTEENPRAAVDWAIRQPAGPIRDRLLARIVHVRAQQDPVEAARLVADGFSTGTMRDQATLAVVRQWAVRDAFAASAWVGAFPAGPLRESAVAELATVSRSQHL